MTVDEIIAIASKEFPKSVKIYSDDDGDINWITNGHGSSDSLEIVDGQFVNFMKEVYGPATVKTLVKTVRHWLNGLNAEAARRQQPDAISKKDLPRAKKLAKKLVQCVADALESDSGEWIVELGDNEVTLNVNGKRITVIVDDKEYGFNIELVPVDVR